jgi:hypothetical protein
VVVAALFCCPALAVGAEAVHPFHAGLLIDHCSLLHLLSLAASASNCQRRCCQLLLSDQHACRSPGVLQGSWAAARWPGQWHTADCPGQRACTLWGRAAAHKVSMRQLSSSKNCRSSERAVDIARKACSAVPPGAAACCRAFLFGSQRQMGAQWHFWFGSEACWGRGLEPNPWGPRPNSVPLQVPFPVLEM